MTPLRFLAAGLLAALALAPSAGAELVVLTDGRFMKVTAFEVRGDRLRVELYGGGAVTLAMSRVERVVDDEIVPAAAPEPERAAPVLSLLEWRFDAERPPPETPFGELIRGASERHGVNAELVAALVRHESAFDPYAISHKGARGLMQLMPATARRFGLRDDEHFVPERNLDAGTRYLRWLLDRYEGDAVLALAAFNAGEGTIARYGGVPPFRETRDYLKRIYTTLGRSELLASAL